MNGNIKSIYLRNLPKIPDHKAVISNIHIGTERGSGYWKLNTSWLNDDNYKNKIRLVISHTVNSFDTHFSSEYEQNLIFNWENNLTLYILGLFFFRVMHCLNLLSYHKCFTFRMDIIIKKIEKFTYNFIWGKKYKIRRRSLICSHSNGGINMIEKQCFFQAIKASWMNRITS